jgi:hypothetical protein
MRYAKLAFALLGLAATLVAANPAIGTWKLNLDKSKYSLGPAPKSATITYEETPTPPATPRPSARNAVRVPSGISVRLRRNPHQRSVRPKHSRNGIGSSSRHSLPAAGPPADSRTRVLPGEYNQGDAIR